MLLLSFLFLSVYAGTTSSRPHAEKLDALARRSCLGAKVHEDGTLELNTNFDPSKRCRKFLKANASRFYQTVLLNGNVGSKA